MEKRILSLLVVACLLATMAPTALATSATEATVADTVVLPNGQVAEVPDLTLDVGQRITSAALEISTEEETLAVGNAQSLRGGDSLLSDEDSDSDIPDSGWEGSGTSSDPYKVYTEDGFIDLSSQFETTSLKVSYIWLMNDLDFTDYDFEDGYVLKYFAGVIQSAPSIMHTNPATITGLGNDVALIYCWVMGTLGYFDMDLNGQASRLTLLPATVGGKYYTTAMQNIEIFSGSKTETGRITVELSNADAQANYAPFVFTTGGNFTMTDCVNYADISGSSYGSVFYGYYPLDANGSVTFTRCINNGVITMRHAAMFFGNNTAFCWGTFGFSTDLDSNVAKFYGCVNNGEIKGTVSAHIFSTRAAEDGYTDTTSDAYETYLLGTSDAFSGNEAAKIITPNMTLYSTESGEFQLEVTNAGDVDHYVLSVYTYIHIYSLSDGEYVHSGNVRYGASQILTSADDEITVKKYGVCDHENDGEIVKEQDDIEGVSVVSHDGVCYYWVDSSDNQSNAPYYCAVSGTWGTPSHAGPDLVTLAAYDKDGYLLGTVSDTPISSDTNNE